jgi:hypothetical protein
LIKNIFFILLWLEPIPVIGAAPDIMMSEVLLIFFVLGLWLSAIGFCLNQYNSLRRLETQVHYCSNRKDPLNIGEIKIVAREQDSIIYKKTRYSTLLDTHIGDDQLKTMHYVEEYLPKNLKPPPSVLANLVVSREDLTSNIPLSRRLSTFYNSSEFLRSSPFIPLNPHNQLAKEQQALSVPPLSLTSSVLVETDINKLNGRKSFVHRTGKKKVIFKKVGFAPRMSCTSIMIVFLCQEKRMIKISILIKILHVIKPTNGLIYENINR